MDQEQNIFKFGAKYPEEIDWRASLCQLPRVLNRDISRQSTVSTDVRF